MSLCPQGTKLYRAISERNRPPERFENRLQASLDALRAYQSHVASCRQCGERLEAAA